MAGTNGKAMLLRAQGKTDEAVHLFFEVIKQGELVHLVNP